MLALSSTPDVATRIGLYLSRLAGLDVLVSEDSNKSHFFLLISTCIFFQEIIINGVNTKMRKTPKPPEIKLLLDIAGIKLDILLVFPADCLHFKIVTT